MELFVDSIKKKYKERRVRQKEDFPPRHQDKLFNLEIVYRESKHIVDILNEDKTKRIKIPYTDFFKTEPGKKRVRRILVEGSAGIGKTTLCMSLSEDWANKQLFQQFDLLLFLPLRTRRVASADSLPALLSFFHSSCDICNSVASNLEKNQGENLLIVADGWDELNESKKQDESFLYDLLLGEQLPFASVILTTRPSCLSNIYRNQLIDRFVEIRGFSKENIIAYFNAELRCDQSKVLNIFKLLESNPLLEDICSIPLNCAIVCHLWQYLNELPSTMTELYTKIILCFIYRNIITKQTSYADIKVLRNFDCIPTDLTESWWLLCKFAFQAIEKNVVAFSEEDLSDFFPHGSSLKDNIFRFGLLQSTESVLDIGYGVSYHFIHLTFQEYLAALHIAKQPPEVQEEICTSRASSLRYSMVWRFFCGIAVRNTDRPLMSHCLNPATVDVVRLLIPAEKEKTIINHLTLLHCAFEANNDNVAAIIAETCKDSVYLRPHSILDCSAINYTISSCAIESTLILNYSNCGIEDNQVIALADSLNKHGKLQIISLDLRNNKLSEKSITYLFSKCSSAFVIMKYLYLGGNRIGHEGLQSVMNAIPQSCFKRLDISRNPIGTCGLIKMGIAMETGKLVNLKRLDIQGCLIKTDANSLRSILKSLSDHCQNLWYLNISDNNINSDCAEIIGEKISVMTKRSKRFSLNLDKMIFGDKALISFVQNLESECHFKLLTLENNDIHAMGVSCLADRIIIMKQTFFKELSLKSNPLGLEGASVIGKMLSSRHCHIETLTLFSCQLTTPCGTVSSSKPIRDVGSFLFSLPPQNTITTLNLGNNNFTGEGIHILVGLIHLCTCLKELSCVSCNITSNDVQQLLYLVSELNCRLTEWDLTNNRIDDEGIPFLLQSANLFHDNIININVWNNPISAEMRKKVDRSNESEWEIEALVQDYELRMSSSHWMDGISYDFFMVFQFYCDLFHEVGHKLDVKDEVPLQDMPSEYDHLALAPRDDQVKKENKTLASQETESSSLNEILDFGHGGVSKHLGMIADTMHEWEGPVAESLGLTLAETAAIKTKYPGELHLQARAALEKWKQRLGPDATYMNLIAAFEQARYHSYAETVRTVANDVPQHTAVPTTVVDNNSSLLVSQSDAPISDKETTLQQEVNSSNEKFKTEKNSPFLVSQDNAPISEEAFQQEINSSSEEVKYSSDDDDIELQTDIEGEVVTCLIL